MRKLIVTCECGQRLRVPYSALGRMGVCVTCGRTIQIMANNARRDGPAVQREIPSARDPRFSATRRTALTEDAKQRFGQAVDLYNAQRYAEALAIFDSFLEQFPGNPEIEEARAQCLSALKRPRLAAPGPMSRSGPSGGDAHLDPETVKRVILEKMLYDPSGANQIEAARLASEILGLVGRGHPPAAKPGGIDSHAQETSPARETDESEPNTDQTGTVTA